MQFKPLIRQCSWVMCFTCYLFAISGCDHLAASDQLPNPQAPWDIHDLAKKPQLVGNDRAKPQKNNIRPMQPKAGTLSVLIEGGTLSFPPFTQASAYVPIMFKIKSGECHKKIEVMPQDRATEPAYLVVCYQNNILYVDPSVDDPKLAQGSLKFSYLPVWKRGFTYPNLSSLGQLKLENVHISIRQTTP